MTYEDAWYTIVDEGWLVPTSKNATKQLIGNVTAGHTGNK